jgi:beta-1,4-mannosyl-glycoprotein beta-1,4-N-acetylglucosaminyltransferase
MIYDCFTFFNELELLEMRLNILDEVVDKFVIVEATLTHQGKSKSLYFEENKHLFSAFSDKIIHVVVRDYPANPEGNAWVYENHQRDMIKEGLKGCQSNDVIIVSDIDEIPNPKQITEYKQQEGIKIFKQTMYYYFLNCMNATNDDYEWYGPVMVNYNDSIGAQELRTISIKIMDYYAAGLLRKIHLIWWKFKHLDRKGRKVILISDGGWHFSYLGGVGRILEKLEAFGHTEYNKDIYKDPKTIEKAITNGDDIFGRGFKYKYVSVDSSYPDCIFKNQRKYRHLIK